MYTAIVRPYGRAPEEQLADYDFLRALYEALLRAREPDLAAIDAAFDALDAAHARLKTAHFQHRGEPSLH